MTAFYPLLTFVHDLARLKADAGEIIWTGIRNYETKTVQRLPPESPTEDPVSSLDYRRPYSELA